jgi:hypothetical protein
MSEPVFPSKSILKRLVSQAGGQWCGVQESVPPLPHLLMFNSPQTGSTLAIRINPTEINEAEIVTAIRTRIAASDKQFKEKKK